MSYFWAFLLRLLILILILQSVIPHLLDITKCHTKAASTAASFVMTDERWAV